uniref:Nucleolar protein 10 n=1 Tax=Pristionchus pacificus TaxID=54126 RepID=A0A2A6BYK8_PRIPA|eukprot:PDM70949.1 nol-10 [Pristionchus pacificus]
MHPGCASKKEIEPARRIRCKLCVQIFPGMQVSKANDVKIYNLSAGKSVPDWLNDRQRRKLEQKNVEVRRRIQLIQDFEMPDVSTALEVTPDGRYIFATGTYKPYLKCFDLKNLSLKFERGLDAEAIKTLTLSDDWTKVVILEEERFVELHHQRGRYFRLRIPRPGRDMDLCRESADLYMVGSSNEIYRLNLEEGVFLSSLVTQATSINCCQFSPVHQLFVAGTSEGTVEAWDHRDRERVSILDVLPSISHHIDGIAAVSAVKWFSSLQIGIGTTSGHTLIFDIRSNRPVIVKDQHNGLPIKRMELVERENDSDVVMSMDDRAVKVWDRYMGKPFAAIEPQNGLNDFVRYPGSGLVLMACESSRMEQYYIPSLGPAPKWCAYLETITEELEETEQPAVYDDYKFVTTSELDQIGLSHLVGTNVLRAYMHGYFMDIRLYNKARTLTQPFAYDKYKDRKLMEEVEKERDMTVVKKKNEKNEVKVNADLAERLKKDAEATIKERRKDKRNKEMKKAEAATSILSDDRFSKLFQMEDYEVDEESEAFTRAKNSMSKKKIDKGKELKSESEEEDEEEEKEDIEQMDTSVWNVGIEEDGNRYHIEHEDDESSSSSMEDKSESENEDEKEKEEKKLKADAARKRQQKRNLQRAFDDVEKERRSGNKPTKFTLHQVDTGETTTKYADGDESDDEMSAPLGSRKEMLMEEGMGDEGREEETPFGGKSLTFTLKKKVSRV